MKCFGVWIGWVHLLGLYSYIRRGKGRKGKERFGKLISDSEKGYIQFCLPAIGYIHTQLSYIPGVPILQGCLTNTIDKILNLA